MLAQANQDGVLTGSGAIVVDANFDLPSTSGKLTKGV